MLTKIVAGIVLWIFVSLVIAAFMNNPSSSFLDAFIAANILMLVAATLVVFIDFVIPWAFVTLFGGSA